MNTDKINDETLEKEYQRIQKETESGGYLLNPDIDFTKELIKSLLINKNRYGYEACPCRLAANSMERDLDIICPCYYRDPDLNDYDTCFCGLYVTKKIIDGIKPLKSIPERRYKTNESKGAKAMSDNKKLPYPVWRCKVCGYICARDNPPENCPVCKAKKERFEKFIE